MNLSRRNFIQATAAAITSPAVFVTTTVSTPAREAYAWSTRTTTTSTSTPPHGYIFPRDGKPIPWYTGDTQ